MDQELRRLLQDLERHMNTGHIERAEKIVIRMLKEYPDHPIALSHAGDFFLHMKEAPLALPLLRRYASIAPLDSKAHFLLGVAYAKVARFWHACESLGKANALRPNDAEIIRQLGWSTGLKGEVEECRNLLLRAIALSPESPFAYADMGASYLFTGDTEKAQAWLAKSLERDPGYHLAKNLQRNLKRDERLPADEQRKRSAEMQDPEYRKKNRIDIMMGELSQMRATQEDLNEVTKEFQSMGLSGQVTSFSDPDSPEGQAAMEYLQRHPRDSEHQGPKLTVAEVNILGKELLSGKTIVDRKKDILITLAHQGTIESFETLKRFYEKRTESELETWTTMALQECKSFLSGKILDEPVITFQDISKKRDLGDKKK